MQSKNATVAASSRQGRYPPPRSTSRSRPTTDTRPIVDARGKVAQLSEGEETICESLGFKELRNHFGPRQDAKTLTSLGTKAGYLKRQTTGLPSGSWNWYYFVMRPATYLYLYKTVNDESPSGIIDMEFLDKIEYKSQVLDAYGKRKFRGSSKYSFRITPSGDRKELGQKCDISIDNIELYLDPTIAKEGSEWIEALQYKNHSPMESLQELEDKLEEVHAQNVDLVEQLKQLSNDKNTYLDLKIQAQQDADYMHDSLMLVSKNTAEAFERCNKIWSSIAPIEGETRRSRSQLRSQKNVDGKPETISYILQEMVGLFEKMNQEIQQQTQIISSLKEHESQLSQQLLEHKNCDDAIRNSASKVIELQQKVRQQGKLLKAAEEKDAQIRKLHQEVQDYSLMKARLEQEQKEHAKCRQKLCEQESNLINLKKNADYQRKMRDLAEARAEEVLEWRQDQARSSEEKKQHDNCAGQEDGTVDTYSGSIKERAGRYFRSASNMKKKYGKQEFKSNYTRRPNFQSPCENDRCSNYDTVQQEVQADPIEDDEPDQDADTSSTSSGKSAENRPLPKGWKKVQSRHYPGDFYYHNTNTGETSWEFPNNASTKDVRDSDASISGGSSDHERDSRFQSEDHEMEVLDSTVEHTEPSEDADTKSTKSFVNLDHSSFMRMDVRRKKASMKTNRSMYQLENKRDTIIVNYSDENDDEVEDEEANVHEQSCIKDKVLLAKQKMQSYKWKKALLAKNSLFNLKHKALPNSYSKPHTYNQIRKRNANEDHDSIY